MTAWEAHIVGAEREHEWSPWCATTRTPGTPATQYATVPLKGLGPHTEPRPTTIRRAGSERRYDAETTEWVRAALEPHTAWRGEVSSLLQAPLRLRLVLHTTNILGAPEIRTSGATQPPSGGSPRRRGGPGSLWRI